MATHSKNAKVKMDPRPSKPPRFAVGLGDDSDADISCSSSACSSMKGPLSKSLDSNLNDIHAGDRNGSRKTLFHGKNKSTDFQRNLKSKVKKEAGGGGLFGLFTGRFSPKGRLNSLHVSLYSLPDGAKEKTRESIAKNLIYFRNYVYGEKALKDKEWLVLVKHIVSCGILQTLLIKLPHLGFEDRKVVGLIFCNMLRRSVSETLLVEYLEDNPKMLFGVLDGYNSAETAQTAGIILRECFRWQSLAKIVLYSDYVHELFNLLKSPLFAVSIDAMKTLQSLVLAHKTMGSEYVMQHYEEFFGRISELLDLGNFATRISLLKFMASVLLERHFYDVMKKYVENSANLKKLILLMKKDSESIRVEAFQVFKIFLATPEPVPKVKKILLGNRDRLIALVETVSGDKNGDHIAEDKAFVLKRLRTIDNEDSTSASGATSTSTDSNTE